MLCERCRQRESEAEVILGTEFLGSLCASCRAALLDPYHALTRELAESAAGATDSRRWLCKNGARRGLRGSGPVR